MSHGNLNNNSSGGIVDRLNGFLARLMGKKNNLPNNNSKKPLNTPSNSKFIVIVMLMGTFLWGLTGLYYVPDGYFGLIGQNGKIIKVVKGLSLGMAVPYPFSSLDVINSDDMSFSIGNESENSLTSITKDKQQMSLSIQVKYQVKDPTIYFKNFYQETSDDNLRMKWIVLATTQAYMQTKSASDLISSSKVIAANEIAVLTNKMLSKYGLNIIELNITNLRLVSHIESPVAINAAPSKVFNSGFGVQIINQAQLYAKNEASEVQSMNQQFNSLLPQYQANKQTIRELMYYKMLSSVPIAHAESYQLLSLTESQFVQMAMVGQKSVSGLFNYESRDHIRSVVRERIFQDR